MKNNDGVSNIVLFLLGTFVSYLGNGIQILCSAYLVLKETHSIFFVGALFIFLTIPEGVLSIFFGHTSDSYNKKTISVTADILRGIVTLIIPAMVILRMENVFIVYIVSFLIALGDAVFIPATNGLIQSTLSQSLYQRFSVWYEISIQVAALISVVIGGYLVDYFGVVPVLCFNGLSYFVSAICIAFMIYQNYPQTLKFSKLKPEYRGFKLIFKDFWRDFKIIPEFFAAGIMFAMIRIIVNLSNTLIVPLVLHLKNGNMSILGLADGCAGIGITLASVVSGYLLKKIGERKMLYAGFLGCGFFLGFLPNFGTQGIICFTTMNAVFFGWGRIAARSTMLRITPPEKSGRYFGLFNGLGIISSGLLAMIISWLTELCGFTIGYGLLSVFIIGVSLWMSSGLFKTKIAANHNEQASENI